MFQWPQPLIAEVAQRRCIAFIGAGISHFSTGIGGARPPLWPVFLDHLKQKMHTPAQQGLVDQLVAKERYLDAAEVIRSDMLDAEYGAFLQQELRDPGFAPAKVHTLLRDLDLSVVVTTNYDTIYEDCCRNGKAANLYNTLRYHDDGLMNDLRSTRKVIIKAHGCVLAQQRTVLSRSSYFQARREFPAFFHILDSLFTTNTLLFLGYGLGDPDIQIVLENIAIKAPTSHPHYVVAAAGQHPAIKAAMQKSYNLHFLEHDEGNYGQVETALEALLAQVVDYRQKHP
jgi:hypothetical protein